MDRLLAGRLCVMTRPNPKLSEIIQPEEDSIGEIGVRILEHGDRSTHRLRISSVSAENPLKSAGEGFEFTSEQTLALSLSSLPPLQGGKLGINH